MSKPSTKLLKLLRQKKTLETQLKKALREKEKLNQQIQYLDDQIKQLAIKINGTP